jgi:hypothetical protein
MRIKRGLKEGLAETHKIKIGKLGDERTSSGGNKFRLPQKLDHFLVTKTTRSKEGNFIVDEKVMKAIGEKPTVIDIMLPYDSIELNFPTAYQFYIGKKKKCQGDGETATRHKQDGSTEVVECNPDTCQYAKQSKAPCKVYGRLHCMISKALRLGGVAVLRSHGWHSVSNILNSLDMISSQTGGVLRGIPLRLELLGIETSEHGVCYVVNVSCVAEDMKELRGQAINEVQERRTLLIDMHSIEAKAIEAGLTEDNDDPADIAAEFYPDPDLQASADIEDLAMSVLENG